MKRYQVTINGKSYDVNLVERKGSHIKFEVLGKTYETVVSSAASGTQKLAKTASKKISDGAVTSPMSGIVVTVSASVGGSVKAGDTLLVVEAMKMENNIAAPKAGTVKAVHVKAGQEVDGGQLLVEVG